MTDRRRVAIARQRMLAAMGDIPSSGDGPASGIADRTGNQAIAPPDLDVARRDWADLDRLEAAILRRARSGRPTAHLADALDRIVTRWQPLDARSAEGLRSKGDDTGAGWCQSHWRVGSAHPPRTPGSRLCRWCEDWLRALTDPHGDWGLELDLPPRTMVELHAQGRRVDPALPPRRRGCLTP